MTLPPSLVKKPMNERMKVRIDALLSVEQAILPGFCEGVDCNESCPMWSEKYFSHCAWTDFTALMTNFELIRMGISIPEPGLVETHPVKVQPNRFEQIIE